MPAEKKIKWVEAWALQLLALKKLWSYSKGRQANKHEKIPMFWFYFLHEMFETIEYAMTYGNGHASCTKL